MGHVQQCMTSTVCVDGKGAHTVNIIDICNYNREGLLLLHCIEYPTMEDHIMHCYCPSCMILTSGGASACFHIYGIESHACKQ